MALLRDALVFRACGEKSWISYHVNVYVLSRTGDSIQWLRGLRNSVISPSREIKTVSQSSNRITQGYRFTCINAANLHVF